jgi:hypothetical protein
MAKGERDWAQLDAFEAEYRDRLRAEQKRKDSQFLTYLNRIARGRETFWSDEINARDPESGRLFALRGKILNLREKVGLPDEKLLPAEGEFVGKTTADTARSPDDLFDTDGKKLAGKGKVALRFVVDPAPEGSVYPVTIEEIKAVLAELPAEHTAPIHEIRLSNQQRTGADGDWLEGEIRLHCLVQAVEPVGAEGAEVASVPEVRRLMGRREGGVDVERWGGRFVWERNRPYAVWPREAYRTFVLRRVLVHEVAHGVAELPGYADRVRRAGSVEKFCEQYAENFHRPPGRSVRLGF